MEEAVYLAFQPLTVLAAASGVCLGIVFGAIPGLSGTLGIALLLPVTFLIPADQSLIMLAGVYAGAVYGGSISAILLNIPGTSAAVITAMEGHVLARNGAAPRALALATCASGIGGLVSALGLLWFSPLLADLALRFGPAEYVMLILFSLAVVSMMLPTPLFGNLAGAAIGLGIATIGLDPFDGTPRFTFGRYELAAGVPLLPVLIGFFAMPQVLVIAYESITRAGRSLVEFGRESGLKGVLGTVFSHLPTFGRASSIGLALGILPALGPESTPITTHALERRFARDPKTFGKGSEQGLMAAECSNNANVGGSLIPLLALGIPGSAAAAVFVGALEIHGLRPGPLLFVENPTVMSTFFVGFFIVNIVMMLIGLFAARYFALVLKIPRGIIATFVAVFAIFGAYAAGNGMFYVYVLIAATVLALALRVMDIPILPVTLGFILGGLFEQQLAIMLTSMRSADEFFGRPIALGFLLLTIAMVAYVGWRRRWR